MWILIIIAALALTALMLACIWVANDADKQVMIWYNRLFCDEQEVKYNDEEC